jgi:hypothetical protein
MKKNLISLAVAASVLGGAAVQAGQYINPDKTGQVLMFPFYNADNGNATNMHVVNTTNQVKALKVRFVEYKNSDEVLDFNLYLSPRDHFAFGVIKDPNGAGGAVITQDNSCTVPALGSPNGTFSGSATTTATGAITRIQPFVNYLYANPVAPDFDSSIERSLMGHVEVIEMGVVSNVGSVVDTDYAVNGAFSQFASWATHGATGVPANCAGLVGSWTADGFWGGVSGGYGLSAQTGGLYGLAYHINVESATAFGFEPTAVDDWGDGIEQYHTNPGTELPSVAFGDTNVVLHDPAGAAIHYTARQADSGAEAVSAILQTLSISNDVMVNPAIGGMTDWVVTFPTKKFHVDTAAKSDVLPPFTDNWAGIVPGTTAGTYKEKPACEKVSIRQYDREEQTSSINLGFSPAPQAASSEICNEVAVIAMGPAGTPSALNVTTGLTNLTAAYQEGWQTITFDSQVMSIGQNPSTLLNVRGLPVIGFGAYKVNNGAMSYGNASEHKTVSSQTGNRQDPL